MLSNALRVIIAGLLLLCTGCATIHRHQYAVAIGTIATGIAAGTAIAIIQNRHNTCPSTYDGKPYQGTPWGPYPCPQYAPGGSHK